MVAGTCLVLLLAFWLLFTSLYNPLAPGSFGGAGRNVEIVQDYFRSTDAYLVKGRQGDTAVVMSSLRNGGPVPIQLVGLTDTRIDAGWSLHWSPIWGGGPVEESKRTRPLPVTVPSGEEVTLWFTIAKPECTNYAKDTSAFVSSIDLRWSVLGRGRTCKLVVEPDGFGDQVEWSLNRRIVLCDGTLDNAKAGS